MWKLQCHHTTLHFNENQADNSYQKNIKPSANIARTSHVITKTNVSDQISDDSTEFVITENTD